MLKPRRSFRLTGSHREDAQCARIREPERDQFVHQKENERPAIIKRAVGIGHNGEGNALLGIPDSALDGSSRGIPLNEMYDPPAIAG